jgi:glyoxylate utilization-related uncharacterized protein
MKFLHKDSIEKTIANNIILNEYCPSNSNLSQDGAYCKINGSFGPKINKSFSELFFVISGSLTIEANNEQHILYAKDMYIVPPMQKHKIIGKECEVFISCAPQFDFNNMEFCDEK